LKANINMYLQIHGLSASPRLFKELMKDSMEFTLTEEATDKRQINP